MITPNDVIAARDRAGMTQQQLADYLGVDVKTLREYEKGNRERLRAGQTALEDFVRAHQPPEPGSAVTTASALAQASDIELVAALSARLAELRATQATGGVRSSGYSSTTTGRDDARFLLDHPDQDDFLQQELSEARARTGRNGAGQKQYEEQIRLHRREELTRALEDEERRRRAAGQ